MSDTIGSMPPPPGVTPNFQHPTDVFHTINLAVNALCLIIVIPILLLRLYTRYRIQHCMNREDWACLIAGILFVPYVALNIFMGHQNGGYHQWEVTELGVQLFMKIEYINAVLYGPTVYSIKITLLLLFTRIFEPSRKTVVLTYIIMALITAFYIPMFFIKIRMCTPIAGFWDKTLNTKCIDEGKLFLSDTLMSVVSDTAVLALPLPLVAKLRLPLKTRIRILGLLGAGVLATATTVVRLVLLVRGGVASDLTFTVLRFSLLGSAEASIGLICASLPALNAFFANIKKSRTVASETKKSTRKQSTAPQMMVNHISFGSARQPPKKGEIRRTDESILHWTYVGMEEGTDEEHAIRDVELGVVPDIPYTKASQPTAAVVRTVIVPEMQINGDIWTEIMEDNENRYKPLPLLPLPQIQRLSRFTIWQEIQEVAEMRNAVVDSGHVKLEEDGAVKDEKTIFSETEQPTTRTGSMLRRPERSWENR